jgi:leucyl-tRNA---protein transferase
LQRFQFSGTLRRLLRQADRFEVDFIPYTKTEEFEELYFYHTIHARFTISPMIDDFLTGSFGYELQSPKCVFETHVVTLRDQGQLIGAGITDLGEESLAGITSFFNPEYRKLSPGKMLLTLKLDIALKNGYRYFYPGYLVPGVPAFNYKTFVGEQFIEVFDFKTKSWVPYLEFVFPAR